jgi:hypothetical protein
MKFSLSRDHVGGVIRKHWRSRRLGIFRNRRYSGRVGWYVVRWCTWGLSSMTCQSFQAQHSERSRDGEVFNRGQSHVKGDEIPHGLGALIDSGGS